jgi:hypothetical protein
LSFISMCISASITVAQHRSPSPAAVMSDTKFSLVPMSPISTDDNETDDNSEI